MPCVGGDIGLNVWVEDNELLFYIGREGCRDENGSLLKMGRVRIAVDPSPFAAGGTFSQELKLREGLVEIRAEAPDRNSATIRVWVEVHRPVVHVDIKTDRPTLVEAAYEGWRHRDVELVERARRHRPTAADLDGLRLPEHAAELDDEARVAPRSRGDPRGEPVVEELRTEGLGRELPDEGVVEGLEHHAVRQVVASGSARCRQNPEKAL
mgnify:CR=1 FL=1